MMAEHTHGVADVVLTSDAVTSPHLREDRDYQYCRAAYYLTYGNTCT